MLARKEKRKQARKDQLRHGSRKAVMLHLRRRAKEKQAESELAAIDEAAAAGEETPLGAAGDETPPLGQDEEAVVAPATSKPEVKVKIEAPATPEPAPWPQPGVEVAVGVEHLSHSLRLGERGMSEGSCPEDPSEVLVHLHSAAVLEEIRIPRSALVPVGMPMRPLRLWDKFSDSLKRDLLRKIGVRDPRDEAVGPVCACWLEAR